MQKITTGFTISEPNENDNVNEKENVNDNCNCNENNTFLNNHNKTKNISIPLIKEIEAYCVERSNNISAQTFFDYYEAKNWMLGKTPMGDWKAAIRIWEQKARKVSKSDDYDEIMRLIEEGLPNE